ncbi:MAG: Response regulator of zinc sigma-54-dependent two-component system [Candidatus Saccharicenans subterraneus]|uniref:histidine kinase n=1 Tax=Candidatus Saccharicenans subterraneus TaxID=2508984 RepID=A0A3E2BQG4_9BACT|nr:MAG: Response regulator of zinc sigma-54-dependent two-component system [Candidatus Saccharicenans subterraneum]
MSQPRILFIDDEEIVLRSCRRIFAGSGYEIETALSGEEGLSKALNQDFDLVVTDLKMPGIGGMEVLTRLRKSRPDTTVIIFTGYASVDTAREALKNGAFDYIPKPFTPEEIREVIKNALEARAGKQRTMLDLMAIVSHELKSPVSALHTTASTLYKGYFGQLSPEQMKILETIIRNCEYLEDIIRSYLDLSKMELDQLDSFKEQIYFAKDVVEEVLTLPEIQDNTKKMTVSKNFPQDVKINGDPRLLRILVRNLVSNAIKYGTEGTEVKLGLETKDGQMVFSVHNLGVGIRPEDGPRLFRKFERLKQQGTEGVKGSGLGLYICKKIVDSHGGKIWFESEPGRWVTFYVSLPLAS